jgi:hypothetical protein
MDIVEREWTSIGTEGFEYYWDPERESDEKGRKDVLFRLASDHDINAVGKLAFGETSASIGYGMERLRMDLEWSWRRRV